MFGYTVLRFLFVNVVILFCYSVMLVLIMIWFAGVFVTLIYKINDCLSFSYFVTFLSFCTVQYVCFCNVFSFLHRFPVVKASSAATPLCLYLVLFYIKIFIITFKYIR